MPCRCGTETDADATRLMGDELRAARSAEMAAAEDFDPLRIRPYVTLGDASAADDPEPTGGDAPAPGVAVHDPAAGGAGGTGAAGGADAATTMRLNLGGVTGPAGVTGPGSDPRTSMGRGHAPAPGTPLAPDESRRRTAAMGAGPGFGAEPPFGAPPGAPDPVQPRRRRPFAALAVGAAVAAVVGTAAFAGGLFGGDDSGDEALPEATTSVPDTDGEPAASVAPSPSASAAPSRTPSRSAAPSASPSASASPTRSREPSPTASASASPTASASPAPEGGGAPTSSPSAAPPAEFAGPSLRPGDRGPEVGVLQNRLREVWLYSGPSDQNYSERVENAVAVYQSYKAIQGDPMGVYGPNTRRALEAETTGRGHG
ncbi:peptidoglycan-binding domain-containing protein [Streptomyces rubiginosohelvolus]|uniref:peptidoglycan-binding domain-containing protein n=1 Tax=Streptomyces rubiginosohelvolus TaxID=67362 RepID=UPI0033CCAD82